VRSRFRRCYTAWTGHASAIELVGAVRADPVSRLRTVKVGSRRLVPVEALAECVAKPQNGAARVRGPVVLAARPAATEIGSGNGSSLRAQWATTRAGNGSAVARPAARRRQPCAVCGAVFGPSGGKTHVIPHLGGRKLSDLRADEVDVWLSGLSGSLSTRMVELCDVPRGRDGRRSKSLTLTQARDLLTRTAPGLTHCTATSWCRC
jgi:hypothetical protein